MNSSTNLPTYSFLKKNNRTISLRCAFISLFLFGSNNFEMQHLAESLWDRDVTTIYSFITKDGFDHLLHTIKANLYYMCKGRFCWYVWLTQLILDAMYRIHVNKTLLLIRAAECYFN